MRRDSGFTKSLTIPFLISAVVFLVLSCTLNPQVGKVYNKHIQTDKECGPQDDCVGNTRVQDITLDREKPEIPWWLPGFTHPKEDELEYAIISQPENGGLLNAKHVAQPKPEGNNRLIYRWTEGDVGEKSFQYIIKRGSFASEVASVNLLIGYQYGTLEEKYVGSLSSLTVDFESNLTPKLGAILDVDANIDEKTYSDQIANEKKQSIKIEKTSGKKLTFTPTKYGQYRFSYKIYEPHPTEFTKQVSSLPGGLTINSVPVDRAIPIKIDPAKLRNREFSLDNEIRKLESEIRKLAEPSPQQYKITGAKFSQEALDSLEPVSNKENIFRLKKKFKPGVSKFSVTYKVNDATVKDHPVWFVVPIKLRGPYTYAVAAGFEKTIDFGADIGFKNIVLNEVTPLPNRQVNIIQKKEMFKGKDGPQERLKNSGKLEVNFGEGQKGKFAGRYSGEVDGAKTNDFSITFLVGEKPKPASRHYISNKPKAVDIVVPAPEGLFVIPKGGKVPAKGIRIKGFRDSSKCTRLDSADCIQTINYNVVNKLNGKHWLKGESGIITVVRIPDPQPPIAKIFYKGKPVSDKPIVAKGGQRLKLDGTKSLRNGGPMMSYHWNTISDNRAKIENVPGETGKFYFTAPNRLGNYQLQLTVFSGPLKSIPLKLDVRVEEISQKGKSEKTGAILPVQEKFQKHVAKPPKPGNHDQRTRTSSAGKLEAAKVTKLLVKNKGKKPKELTEFSGELKSTPLKLDVRVEEISQKGKSEKTGAILPVQEKFQKHVAKPPKRDNHDQRTQTARAEKLEAAKVTKLLIKNKRKKRKEATAQAIRNRRQLHIVKRGETLQTISQRYFKKESRWREIFNANKTRIKNPNRIYFGQVIFVPISETSNQPKNPS